MSAIDRGTDRWCHLHCLMSGIIRSVLDYSYKLIIQRNNVDIMLDEFFCVHIKMELVA